MTRAEQVHMNASAPTGRHDLLTLLNAVVLRESGGGQQARVCFGVANADSSEWWLADLSGSEPETSFHHAMPSFLDFDVLVCLGEEEAEAALQHGRIEAGGCAMVLGDRKLLRQFADRYFQRISLLGMRMQRIQNARSSEKVRGKSRRWL